MAVSGAVAPLELKRRRRRRRNGREGFRVLNIGFQLINWAENGAGELEHGSRKAAESGSITPAADVSLAAIGRN